MCTALGMDWHLMGALQSSAWAKIACSNEKDAQELCRSIDFSGRRRRLQENGFRLTARQSTDDPLVVVVVISNRAPE